MRKSGRVDATRLIDALSHGFGRFGHASCLATPLRAKDCPVQDFGLEAREDAIRKASTCRQALEIMDACAYGASGDTGLGAAVRERCEPEFLPKLRKAQKRAYDREQRRCDQKYARQSGTHVPLVHGILSGAKHGGSCRKVRRHANEGEAR